MYLFQIKNRKLKIENCKGSIPREHCEPRWVHSHKPSVVYGHFNLTTGRFSDSRLTYEAPSHPTLIFKSEKSVRKVGYSPLGLPIYHRNRRLQPRVGPGF
jgi:hypothetical protein